MVTEDECFYWQRETGKWTGGFKLFIFPCGGMRFSMVQLVLTCWYQEELVAESGPLKLPAFNYNLRV